MPEENGISENFEVLKKCSLEQFKEFQNVLLKLKKIVARHSEESKDSDSSSDELEFHDASDSFEALGH